MNRARWRSNTGAAEVEACRPSSRNSSVRHIETSVGLEFSSLSNFTRGAGGPAGLPCENCFGADRVGHRPARFLDRRAEVEAARAPRRLVVIKPIQPAGACSAVNDG